MVCDNIVYHPSLTRLIQFLDTTAGREKAFRLIQYLCRFLGFQYKSLLAKQLQVQFTTTRKLLRFLKPLNLLRTAAKLYDNKIGPDDVLRWANVIKNLFSAAYLTLDQVNLLRMLKLIPVTPFTGKTLPRWTNWMWFGALVSGILGSLRTIEVSQKRIVSLLREGDEKDAKLLEATYQERFKAARRLVWDGLDMYIVLNNLQYLNSQEGSIGLAGVATSLFGLQDLWKAT
ncbi:HEL200Cp [Eremothecium sinecaudum]|uniref:HEL200Cp n=1 Tax=Eremothecium sinecaudum TaxID=45286 RepID=A0A0X8HTB7_9SACH|nr:HEL200Cp [Eremothecium sinecaudum]AMD21081.1 HEL200Cp [Eremothecium sinecaudum]